MGIEREIRRRVGMGTMVFMVKVRGGHMMENRKDRRHDIMDNAGKNSDKICGNKNSRITEEKKSRGIETEHMAEGVKRIL